MSDAPDFDSLVAQAKESGDVKDLWRPFYGLESLWVLTSPDRPEQPFLGNVDGAGWAYVFTDPTQLRQRAISLFDLADSSQVSGIKMIFAAGLDWLVGLASAGVAGVRVNDGDSGFTAPLANLLPMRDYYQNEA